MRKCPCPRPTRRARPPLSRRALVAGAVPVVAAAIGAVGALAVQYSRKAEAPGRETTEAAADGGDRGDRGQIAGDACPGSGDTDGVQRSCHTGGAA